MPDLELATRSLDHLMELSPEMRGGAILESGKVLAATGEEAEWGQPGAALLAAADVGGEPAEQVHVATEAGEVFAIREGRFAAIAVTDRFVLASLMAFDMRSTLRDLAAGGAATNGAAAPGAS
jgi:hypothetical protein